jgi:hypothetical protein
MDKRQAVQQHLEKALDEIRVQIFDKAAARILALKDDEKVPATQLAEELAREIIQADGKPMTGPQVYPTLKIFLRGLPCFEITRGAHGGIKPLKQNADPVAQPAADADDGDRKTIVPQ